MTLEGPRILDQLFPWCDIDTATELPGYPLTITAGQGWELLDDGALGTPTAVNRTYYDLSGYNLEFLTSFFQGVDVQESFSPFGTISMSVIDLVTTEFIDDATLLAAHIYTTGDGDLPGFPNSTFDMSQVIYGRTRTFVDNSSWGDISLQGQTTFGTCAATTADKVHLTRVIYVQTGVAGVITADKKIHIPPCNYVSAIIVAEEKELSFLMRQKRSYELATGP